MSYIRPTLAIIILLAIFNQASANDSAYFASGNQIIPLQETDISVKKEVLTIKRIKDDKVQVTVDYTFHNPGKEKTIHMGFEADSPVGGVDGTPKRNRHPYIENFTVAFNGDAIPHKVTILFPEKGIRELKSYTLEDLKNQKALPEVEKDHDTNFFYVYHFPAKFKSGDTQVRHTYEYKMGISVYTRTEIDYLLTPALRWANKQIDDFTLNIDLGEFQQYHINPTFFENTDSWTTHGRVKIGIANVQNKTTEITSKMMTVWQHKGSVTFHAKNFIPRGELSIFSNRSIALYEVLDSDNIKFFLPDLPWVHELKLKDEFTRKVLENIPYARRGYIFKNAELKAYFDAQPWYMPDPEYKDTSLTEEEKDWLKAVRELKITAD